MKKIIALMLFMTLCAAMCPVQASETVISENAVADYSFDLINSLKIDKNINSDGNAYITRKEFAAMVVRAINKTDISVSDVSFDDVEPASDFADEIYTAKALGITNGTSPSTFSPDGLLGRNAAIKMILVALGYEQTADAYGGFPSGYMKIESQLDLLDGTCGGDILTVNDAKIIVTNALTADIPTFSAIEDDNISFSIKPGRNLLTENFGLKKVYGVVSKAGYLNSDNVISNDSYIIISGEKYKSAVECEKYFAMTVSAWADTSDSTIYAIERDDINTEITIDAKDVCEFDNGILKAYDGDKLKSYNIDLSVSFMENGRLISHCDEDYMFSDGTLRLVDNNGDRKYDYVFANKKAYFIIEAVDFTDKTIYDSNSPLRYIDLSVSDDKVSEITDIHGNTVDFSQIVTGSAVEVYISDDRSVCRIVYDGSHKISGVVSETDGDFVNLDGVRYDLNSYFGASSPSVVPGRSYSFILSPDGTVTAFDSKSSDGVEYGYFLAFSQSVSLDSSTKIKLLSASGKIEVFELAENITFDGESKVKKTDNRIKSTFVNTNSTYNYQLIRYKTNTDNKIVMLDTNNRNLNTDWEIDETLPDDDSLTQYLDNKTINIYYSNGFAVPGFTITKSIVFAVPPEIKSAPATANYDDDMFSVIPYSSLENDIDHKVDVFDFDTSYSPEAVVVYEQIGAESSTSTATHVVYSVNDAINTDGVATKVINSYSKGRYYRRYVSVDKLSAITLPKPGDIVRFERNTDDEITKINIDVTTDTATGKKSIRLVRNYVSTLNYISGTVKSFRNGNLVLQADEKPLALMNDKNIAPLPLGTTPRYAVYDISENKVYVVDASAIQTEEFVGSASADYVVCAMRYYAVNDVIIYRP